MYREGELGQDTPSQKSNGFQPPLPCFQASSGRLHCSLKGVRYVSPRSLRTGNTQASGNWLCRKLPKSTGRKVFCALQVQGKLSWSAPSMEAEGSTPSLNMAALHCGDGGDNHSLLQRSTPPVFHSPGGLPREWFYKGKLCLSAAFNLRKPPEDTPPGQFSVDTPSLRLFSSGSRLYQVDS